MKSKTFKEISKLINLDNFHQHPCYLMPMSDLQQCEAIDITDDALEPGEATSLVAFAESGNKFSEKLLSGMLFIGMDTGKFYKFFN